MKVLLITSDYLPRAGGVSIFNQGIAESLALAGHRVWVLTPDTPDKDDEKLTYRVIRYKATKYLGSIWPSLITLYLSLINKYDVILYGHAVSTLSLGGILARKLNMNRLAMLTHGNDLDYAVSCNIDKYFLEQLITTADIILANSNFTREKVQNRYPNIDTKVKILNPGVWPERVCQSSDKDNNNNKSKLIILTVARLVPVKGVDDLISAFALVINKYPEAILRIVGDGPEKEKLVHLAKQLNIENSIYFAGELSVKRVYDELQKCSYFVMPSKGETFGIAYLEANAYGKAVIGTRQGGVPDSVVDGITGILVEPGNIEQLAEAMQLLIENKELRNKLGLAGKHRVESEFNWSQVVKRFEAYISEIE